MIVSDMPVRSVTSNSRCPFSQIGPTPRSPYILLSNGSLLLQPLSKDHHGGWECLATNRVATVSAGTVVVVLGKLIFCANSFLFFFNLHKRIMTCGIKC